MTMPETNDLLTKSSIAKFDTGAAGSDRLFTAIITTDAVDDDDEVLLPEGMRANEFKKHPIILWHHDRTKPIGKAMEVSEVSNGWQMRGVFGSTPLATDVYTLVKEGIVRGVSVGYKVLPGGSREPSAKDRARFGDRVRRVINKWSLREVSVTAMPANMDAVITAVKSAKVTRDQVKAVMGIDVPEQPQARRVYLYEPPAVDVVSMVKRLAERAAREAVARRFGKMYLDI